MEGYSPPMTPAELEAKSLALAYQLQQEEHAALMQAVRVSSPMETAQQMDTESDDVSLRLAMQLQQQEALLAGVDGEFDEDALNAALSRG